ncbi:cytochrome p450 [Trifolium pratense]|uniref:Cytochrome p450 n=1 Tax=Trifolium pratense TaxID=57577 RepID=A0A2K3NB60_TRIPR|nr:cytochrome p450 [Trifolium pratense]
MMRAMVQSQIFTCYSIGSVDSTVVSHLQFADDTLLQGVKSWANVRAIRVVLVLFEQVSGLRGSFVYLGLPIGGDPKRLSFWDPPVYVLSFFKAPPDRGGLWYRVLVARYGEVAGRLAVGRQTDPWLGGVPLRERYGRLFDLSNNKSSSVAVMFELGWKEGGGVAVATPVMGVGGGDVKGMHDHVGGYSVRDAYHLLTATEVPVAEATSDLTWHKQIPLKVSVLSWRLFRNRSPTRDFLALRNIIHQEAQFCVTGCGGLEATQHLFLSCPVFASLWNSIQAWIGIQTTDSDQLQDHLVQFVHSSGGLRACRSFLQLV